MSEISPRPWRKRVFDDGSFAIVSGPGGLGFVCQYTSNKADEEEREMAEADGSLIAAAPDLLEALRSVNDVLMHAHDHDVPAAEWERARAAAMAEAFKVIARAEGR